METGETHYFAELGARAWVKADPGVGSIYHGGTQT